MNFTPFSSGLSLMRILGSASRALGILRQISPIVNDFKPLVAQVPKLYNHLVKMRENVATLSPMLKTNLSQFPQTTNNAQSGINTGPNFFQ